MQGGIGLGLGANGGHAGFSLIPIFWEINDMDHAVNLFWTCMDPTYAKHVEKI